MFQDTDRQEVSADEDVHRTLPFFATAGTMGGLNGLKGYGFTGASDEDDTLGDLFQFYMPGEAERAAMNNVA